jgi:hypothetical protein
VVTGALEPGEVLPIAAVPGIPAPEDPDKRATWPVTGKSGVIIGLGCGADLQTGAECRDQRVKSHEASVASAIVNTAQQIGGSIGTADPRNVVADPAALRFRT